MKPIRYIVIFSFLVSCASVKETSKTSLIPTKFVFQNSMITSKKGVLSLKTKTDSLINNTYNPKGKNSLMNRKLKEMKIQDFLIKTPSSEIHINVKNDSIWRHTNQNNKMIGDYFMIKKESGILHYYDKSKSINYRKYNLFSKEEMYTIIENRKDIKKIKGYDCYKLKLIEKSKSKELGNNIYEMYVTNKIKLPIHSVINLTLLIQDTFPMEILIYNAKFPNIAEKYELIEIKY